MKKHKPVVVVSGGNDHAITNCCAALRRLLERLVQEPDFFGHPQMQVVISNSRIQSYRTGILIPAPK